MRILTRSKQQKAYTLMVEVIKVLASVRAKSPKDEMNCDYAIGDMWQLARIIGGKDMLNALEVKK